MEIVVLVVIPSLLLIVWAVWYLRRYYKAQHAAFDRYAVPLLPIVAGTVEKQTIRGTYAGLPVVARIRGLSVSQTGEDGYRYEFRIELATGAGGADWSLAGADARAIRSKDPSLAARLGAAGVADAMERWPGDLGVPAIANEAKLGRLVAATRVPGVDGWPQAPTFTAQLECLAAIAAANRAANQMTPA